MKLRLSAGVAVVGAGATAVWRGARRKPGVLGSFTSPSEGSLCGGGEIEADGGGSSGPLRPQPASAKAADSAAIAARRSNQ